MAESPSTESIQIDTTRPAICQEVITLEEALCFIKQPAIREAIENHKSNWVANSKGGEPNHKP